jgi:UDP-GlcNAc:undecaprenyl-phosphate GlcNAc-1-phosphate transferase
MVNFLFYSSTFLLLIFLNYNAKKISLIFKLYKTSKGKITNSTPLVGGLNIFIFLLIIFIYSFFIELNNIGFVNIFIISSILFLIGILDDIFDIKHYLRLALTFIVLTLMLNFTNSEYIVKALYFETLQNTFYLSHLSVPITALFIVILLNALNMADGANGITISFSIIIFLFYFNSNNNLNLIILPLIIVLILNLIFNLNNKLDLGDSGIYLISFIISIYIISNYNNQESGISCEKIFLSLMIPGIDMIRLFFQRILKGANPLKGDQNHFHHFLMRKFNANTIFIIYSIVVGWPLLLIGTIPTYVLIILNLYLYSFLIYYSKNS